MPELQNINSSDTINLLHIGHVIDTLQFRFNSPRPASKHAAGSLPGLGRPQPVPAGRVLRSAAASSRPAGTGAAPRRALAASRQREPQPEPAQPIDNHAERGGGLRCAPQGSRRQNEKFTRKIMEGKTSSNFDDSIKV